MDEHKVRLEISELSKSYETKEGRFQAVEKIDLKVYDNEFLVLLGPGNCGKTVLLNMIAGLEQPTSGEIRLDGSVIQGSDRRIGMVFQKLALMPWKTVMQNTEIGPKFRGVKKEERRKKAQSYIDLVGLNGFEKAYPAQLSGGMKQRLLIAATIIGNPNLLIFDEPTAGLDPKERVRVKKIMSDLAKDKIVIIATHIVPDIENIANEIIILKDGIIREKNTPEELIKKYAENGNLEDVYMNIFGE